VHDGAGSREAASEYRRALECLLGVPATDGNRVGVLRNGDRFFPAMLEAVGAAVRTVDMQTFGYWSGEVGQEFADALSRRASAGVRVRLLIDALGAQVDKGAIRRMEAAGVEFRWFRPLPNWRITENTHRGHRKLLVCDGEVAFTGGAGIADRWRGDGDAADRWRDTQLRIEGPAVKGLWGAFVDNWSELDHSFFDQELDLPVVPAPAGPSPVQVVQGKSETGWGDVSTLVRAFTNLSRSRLRIGADFFVPDDDALAALAQAVSRGVAVDLLRPGPHVSSRLSQLTSRAQYPRLLDAGLSIFEFQPAMFHAPVLTVDGIMACVGSINFNARSLTLDEEVVVVLFDPDVVSVLDADFDADLLRAETITAEICGRWAAPRRALQAVPGYLARRL
jgi:cardiolipin synthase